MRLNEGERVCVLGEVIQVFDSGHVKVRVGDRSCGAVALVPVSAINRDPSVVGGLQGVIEPVTRPRHCLRHREDYPAGGACPKCVVSG